MSYHSGPEWNRQWWQWWVTPAFLKLQYYENLTIRLFSVIYRDICWVGGLPLDRDVIGVFYPQPAGELAFIDSNQHTHTWRKTHTHTHAYIYIYIYYIYICVYVIIWIKIDLALINLQRLTYHKTQTTNIYIYIYIYIYIEREREYEKK